MAVAFGELKTGDKIARHFKRLDGDFLVTDWYQTHTVQGVSTGPNKMVHLKADITGDTYTIHEGLHVGIEDELKSWDKMSV